MTRVAVTASILATIAQCAAAQTLLTGRVVADDSGDPIRNARVTLASTALGIPVVLADDEGRFSFTAPPGQFTVVASKSGYARGEQRPPGSGAPVEIRLQRGATISGQVVDEYGDLVPNVRVGLEARSSSAANPPTVATATTDDRGEYRLAGLSAGTFLIAALTIDQTPQVINNNQLVFGVGMRKTYYPGATDPDQAQVLRLQPGEERRPIDLVVPAQRPTLPPVALMRRLQPPSGPPLNSAGGTSVLRGHVVAGDGRAVVRAHVTLLTPADLAQSQAAASDEDGGFEFRDVVAGPFEVTATKPGYSPVAVTRVSGRLAEGEARERVEIHLARLGTVTGQVLDELGDPLQGVSVQALHVRYEAGRRRLVPASAAARLTDDLGRYRLFGLPPGQYIISGAMGAVASAELPGYARSYYPGTANAGSAQFVSMAASQDVTGIDFALTRTRTARVSGRLLNAAGEPAMAGSLTLRPSQSSTAVTSAPVGARILSDGTFEFPNVAPGQYIVQAYRGRLNSWTEGEFGVLPVSVDGADVKDLVLQTSVGSSIKGRVTFDTLDRSKALAPSAIALAPIPADFDLSPGNFATADVQTDWSFEIAGLNGPRRLQLLHAPAGWALKEIRVNGIDATDRVLPFGRKDQSLSNVEVVLTDRINELRGTVADDQGRPIRGAFAIVFSTDRDRWYASSRFLRAAASGPEGTFTVAGLPFGSYFAAAVPQLPAEGEDAWQAPELLEALVARATTVTIGMGQPTALSLRIPGR